MKKFTALLLLALAAIGFSGCASIETVRQDKLNGQKLSAAGTAVAHINIQNWGLYLLNIPLFAGSTCEIGYPIIFTDTVNINSIAPLLAKEAKKLGGTHLLDTASQYKECGFIIVKRSLNMSGNAVR